MNCQVNPTTVPCKFCGEPTGMTGPKMCNGCWEVDRRVDEFARTQAGKDRLVLAIAGWIKAEGWR